MYCRYNRGVQVRYRVFREEKRTETEFALPADPTGASTRRQLEMALEHSRRVRLPPMTREQLDYFENGCITLLVYVQQEERGFRAPESLVAVRPLSTKVLLLLLRLCFAPPLSPPAALSITLPLALHFCSLHKVDNTLEQSGE